jgi:hypothetical protein
MAFRLLQECVFTHSKPVKVDSWEDFTKMKPPEPDMKSSSSIMLTAANDPYPVSWHPRFTMEQRHAVGTAMDEEALQKAAARASKADSGVGMTHMVMIFMGVALLVLTLIMGFIAADAIGWLGEPASTVTKSPEVSYWQPLPHVVRSVFDFLAV